MTISEIAERLGGARAVGNGGYMARCPAHEDHTPSLSIDPGDKVDIVVRCFAGCDGTEIIRRIRELGIAGRIEAPRGWRKPTLANAGSAVLARELWREARPAASSVVEVYLRSRGITCAIPPTIRFVSLLNHTEAGEAFPVMLGAVAVWPSNRVHAVHRTYLRYDGAGKAPTPAGTAKKMLGPCRGGAVRLAPAGETLGVAEGLETALSAMQIEGIPVWAALSAVGVERVVLPAVAKHIMIFADRDEHGAGEKAAEKARARFEREGRTVTIKLPPEGHKDFNDVLRADK
jgi:hypothetical protein